MAEHTESAPEFEQDSESKYAGLRMLAVDDEPVFLKTYEKYFGKHGFAVETASSQAQFLELLRSQHHHIILLDYYLDNDKVDGDAMMRLVETHDRDASVIVVTGRP